MTHIALLRGINVGGNNKVPMPELKAICEDLGFTNVRTYIQTGNVLFESGDSEAQVVEKLEQALQESKQRYIAVMVRSAKELEAVLANNPFPDASPSQVGVLFFSKPVPKDVFEGFTTTEPEEVVVSGREIYINYVNGMGRSKLKLPKMPEQGTARNINTVAKLVELSEKA